METLILGFFVLLLCLLSGLIGFIGGKGMIVVKTPLTSAEKERRDKIMSDMEGQMEAVNRVYGNFAGFGGDLDEL